MDIGDRIRQVRAMEGLSLGQFGQRIGLGQSTISMMENGHSSVTEQTIRSICREFHITETWLRTGEGEVQDYKSEDEYLAVQMERMLTADASAFRRRLVSILIRMPDEQLQVLEEIAKQLADDSYVPPPVTPYPTRTKPPRPRTSTPPSGESSES